MTFTVISKTKYSELIAPFPDNEKLANNQQLSIKLYYELQSTPNLLSASNSNNWTSLFLAEIWKYLGTHAPNFASLITHYELFFELENIFDIPRGRTKELHNQMNNKTIEIFFYHAFCYTDDNKEFFSNNLVEGRLPDKPYEILISDYDAQELGLNVGDEVTLTRQISDQEAINASISGIFNYTSCLQLSTQAKQLGFAGDTLMEFHSIYSFVLPIEYLYLITENIELESMALSGYIQLLYAHRYLNQRMLIKVNQELNNITNVVHRFSFGVGWFKVYDEFSWDWLTVVEDYTDFQYIVFAVVVPLLFVLLFLLFGIFTSYRESYLKAIKLNGLELSTKKVQLVYFGIRILEIMATVLVSVCGAIAVSLVLDKTISYFSFKYTVPGIIYNGLIAVGILLLLSILDMIKLSQRRLTAKKSRIKAKATSRKTILVKKILYILSIIIRIAVGAIFVCISIVIYELEFACIAIGRMCDPDYKVRLSDVFSTFLKSKFIFILGIGIISLGVKPILNSFLHIRRENTKKRRVLCK